MIRKIEWKFSKKEEPIFFSCLEYDNIIELEKLLEISCFLLISKKFPNLQKERIKFMISRSIRICGGLYNYNSEIKYITDEEIYKILNIVLARTLTDCLSYIKNSMNNISEMTKEQFKYSEISEKIKKCSYEVESIDNYKCLPGLSLFDEINI